MVTKERKERKSEVPRTPKGKEGKKSPPPQESFPPFGLYAVQGVMLTKSLLSHPPMALRGGTQGAMCGKHEGHAGHSCTALA